MTTGWEKWKQRFNDIKANQDFDEKELTADEKRAVHESEQEKELGRHLEKCGVPRRDIEIILKGLQETEAVAGIRRWIKTGKTFCLLAGAVGLGKTVAASTVLKMARKGVYFMRDSGEILSSWSYNPGAGLFVRAAELSSTSPYAEEGRGHWSRVRRVPWLVIDDLGTERMDNAGIWAEQFDLLIDSRYSDRRKTVITTNLGSDDFIARYRSRAWDRINHDGESIICEGKSMRIPNG